MASQQYPPPTWANRLLEWAVKPDLVEEVLGDLEEKYTQELQQKSPFWAKANYWYQTLNYLRPFALRSDLLTDFYPFFMFRHHLKLSFRNFLKDRTTFLINLVGLSTGLACALFIFLWVSDERSVDKFHEKDDRLYQVMKRATTPDGRINVFSWTPMLLAETLKAEMAEVEWAAPVRLHPDDQRGIVRRGASRLQATEQYTSADFFQLFSYPIVEGQPEHFLQQKSDVILSDRLAQKLFGRTAGLIGETVTWEKPPFSGVYRVAGIYEYPPATSTQQFDLIFNYRVVADQFPERVRWDYGGPDTYIALREGADVAYFEKKLAIFLQEKSQEDYQSLFIQKYSDKYLYGRYENGQPTGGRIGYVRLFSVIGLFVLFIACINFMNLSTAKATQRAKEIGVKKTVGAERGHLITQFLSESSLLAILAMFVALWLLYGGLPEFNKLTGKDLRLSINTNLLLGIGTITLLTGLVAGSYPAFFLSGFRPVSVLKGRLNRTGGTLWLRRGLVVFQFSISISLIVAVLVTYYQIQFVQQKNLGFNKDQLIRIKKDGTLNEQLPVFLNAIKQIPNVVNVAGLKNNLLQNESSTIGVSWDGQAEDNKIPFKYLSVDFNLLETIGAEMVAGRTFQQSFGDETDKIIFNEAAIEAMGLRDPVGQTVRQWGRDRQIIGVVRDFHLESLYEPVKPAFVTLGNSVNDILVRVAAGHERRTVEELSAIYEKLNDGFPMTYEFLDTQYDALYQSEMRVARLSKYFAGVAILISCLGLFGLVTFAAQRRRKEISIRKVLGAHPWSIVRLLSADFTKMVLVALAIALPLSYLGARQWLDQFAFHTPLSAWFFLVAGFSVLGIAWLTVGLQTLKAASVNPTLSLKSE